MELERQKDWGLGVAADLFFAGAGAGAYAAGVISHFISQKWLLVSKIGVIIGFPLVLIGTLFLLADLGTKRRAYRAFLNPGTSWITRGTIIINTFMLLGAIHIGTWIWPFTWLEGINLLFFILSIVNFIFAISVMIYTGVLLGASRPIPFWSTAMLPMLFLISALSAGIMGIILFLSIYGFAVGIDIGGQLAILIKLIVFLLAAEALLIAFYLQATHRTEASRASSLLLTRGELAPQFWGGVVIVGIFIPLTFGLAAFLVGTPSAAMFLISLIITIPGLFGGFMLRHLIIAGGVRAPLRAGQLEFPLPAS